MELDLRVAASLQVEISLPPDFTTQRRCGFARAATKRPMFDLTPFGMRWSMVCGRMSETQITCRATGYCRATRGHERQGTGPMFAAVSATLVKKKRRNAHEAAKNAKRIRSLGQSNISGEPPRDLAFTLSLCPFSQLSRNAASYSKSTMTLKLPQKLRLGLLSVLMMVVGGRASAKNENTSGLLGGDLAFARTLTILNSFISSRAEMPNRRPAGKCTASNRQAPLFVRSSLCTSRPIPKIVSSESAWSSLGPSSKIRRTGFSPAT
jgi:hypothetical protein